MDPAAATVKLDDDVQEELRKLAERSGRSLGALANEALRDFLRYEHQLAASIDSGLADLDEYRTRAAHEVLALLEQQRLARTRG
ncbi:MAG TPA: ribbon-helix-helix protein, CopG family [Kofleriaceae bacterium]|jgi:predicted transcriptional regulator|nr:ribbon-helix-helix protein, CopG family [Kofleriaceae bacterium]